MVAPVHLILRRVPTASHRHVFPYLIRIFGMIRAHGGMGPSEKSNIIKHIASELGFIGCGISKVQTLEKEAIRIAEWLSQGRHGEMTYMANHFEKRIDPAKLVSGAQSVVSVLMNYATPAQQKDPDAPVLSKYAYGEDYHFVMKKKLRQMLTAIRSRLGDCQGRLFVDSAPVLERAWAARSGLGWIGKHSLLLNRRYGSFFFIGELIVDLELAEDRPSKDYCGECTRCIDACPTSAIVQPHVVDARKCISYLTIEHKSNIPGSFKGSFNNRVFGCDICQDVCPWNLNAPSHDVEALMPSEELMKKTRQEWFQITEKEFLRVFQNSAVKRAKYQGLRRNLEFIREDLSSDPVRPGKW